jgi:hypothetical protein
VVVLGPAKILQTCENACLDRITTNVDKRIRSQDIHVRCFQTIIDDKYLYGQDLEKEKRPGWIAEAGPLNLPRVCARQRKEQGHLCRTSNLCVGYNSEASETQGRKFTIQLLNIYNMLNEIVPSLLYLASHKLPQ